jgi:WhiB family transcriptional regulator, redox-sensing transcriptional regulator
MATKTWWKDQAACVGVDPELFFPPSGNGRTQIKKAKTICESCPVKAECRAYADRSEERLGHRAIHGIYGGETPTERLARRREAAEHARPLGAA